MQVYDADEIRKQLNHEEIRAARCTIERLLGSMSLHGVKQGKVIRTTVPDTHAPYPSDRVNRHFKADRTNQLWV
jgi:transposase InsO family protein